MKQYKKSAIEKVGKQFETENYSKIHFGKTLKKNIGRMLMKTQCESMRIKDMEGYDSG